MSSSIFTYYKIISKDENIKDIYVGKTKNFKNRVREHRNNCNKENCKCYNYKLYKYIRENGGWDNFNMIEIEKGEYNDKDSAIREKYWIEELNATLNSNIPSRTLKDYFKEYRENNREKYNKRQKKYIDKNREIINEKQRKNYEINKKSLIEYQKEYRKINVEKINEKIICECGCKIVKRFLSIHLKTQKHLNYLSKIK
jgi:hypothetical protein